MPTMRTAGLLHTHCRAMLTSHQPHHQQTQCSMPTHPRCHQNNFQRRGHHILTPRSPPSLNRRRKQTPDHRGRPRSIHPPTITRSRIPLTKQQQQPPLTTDWLNPPTHNNPHPRRNRRVDVSIDTKTLPKQRAASIHDEEGAVAPGIFRLGPSRKKTSTA